MKVLIFGSSGWIGSQLVELFSHIETKEIQVFKAKSRLTQHQDIESELASQPFAHVVCAAGLTGSHAPPYNVDWCEDNKDQVVAVNVEGVLFLASLCNKLGIHFTYFGTGCIYEYDQRVHPVHQDDSISEQNALGFTEQDWPNFDKSFYSKTKIWCEFGLRGFLDTTLVLRIRMPIVGYHHPRNFVTKICNYEKVVNVPNSMTLLPSLLPVAIDMMLKRETGIYNFCNPGAVSHNEILELYRKYVDQEFAWENFSLEEQAKILKAGRSNNTLNVNKLLAKYPNIPDVQTGLENLFADWRK